MDHTVWWCARELPAFLIEIRLVFDSWKRWGHERNACFVCICGRCCWVPGLTTVRVPVKSGAHVNEHLLLLLLVVLVVPVVARGNTYY